MNKRALGSIFIVLGALALAGGAYFAFAGGVKIVSGFTPAAKLAAPGQVSVTVEEAGKVTLWHDYRTMDGASTVSNPEPLPGGFSFAMKRDSDQQEIPFEPIRGSETISLPDRDSSAVGRFNLPSAGSYTLIVSATGGEVRHFSVTEGGVLTKMAEVGGSILLAGILGLFGLMFLILGLVFVLLKGKNPAQPPPPPHPV